MCELKEKIKWCFIEMSMNGTESTEVEFTKEELLIIDNLLDNS